MKSVKYSIAKKFMCCNSVIVSLLQECLCVCLCVCLYVFMYLLTYSLFICLFIRSFLFFINYVLDFDGTFINIILKPS